MQEPYVIECLEGTPGPARWSDGSMAFSQWCFDQHSGNEYLRREREANTFECDGQVCRNPYTGGSYPDPNAVATPPVHDARSRILLLGRSLLLARRLPSAELSALRNPMR
ncbi:hypothetical protein GS534_04535 [Rhodococcus hoagii]|nr:hypothetical protein [Prescottella equi]